MLLPDTYCLYKNRQCVYDINNPIDVSSVPFNDNIGIKMKYGRYRGPVPDCSLVLTYNTPARFIVKSAYPKIRMGETDCFTIFDGTTTDATRWLRKCGNHDDPFTFVTTGPAVTFHMAFQNDLFFPVLYLAVSPVALDGEILFYSQIPESI